MFFIGPYLRIEPITYVRIAPYLQLHLIVKPMNLPAFMRAYPNHPPSANNGRIDDSTLKNNVLFMNELSSQNKKSLETNKMVYSFGELNQIFIHNKVVASGICVCYKNDGAKPLYAKNSKITILIPVFHNNQRLP